jgi:hypothetical protein
MLIKNNKVYELDHRAFSLKGDPNKSILGFSKEGKITIINPERGSQNSLTLAVDIRDISFSGSKKLISLIDDSTGNLVITDFQGQVLFWEKPPQFTTNYAAESEGFLSCHFDHNEKYFWCIAALPDFNLEIQLRQIDTYSIIDKVAIEDPFGGDSSYSFYPTNRPNLLSLWGAAGQDGQQTFWVENINEKIICKEEFLFSDTTPPAFSQNGSEFLILDDDSIDRYQYPSLKMGSCEWLADNNDDAFGYHMGYLNENYALVGSNNGRAFLLDVKEMKIVEELIIEDHPPLPTSNYYPSLKDDNLCTDLLFFECFDNNFVFVYRRDKDTGLKDWKYSLLIIPAEKILLEFSSNSFLAEMT